MEIVNNHFDYRHTVAAGYRAVGNIKAQHGLSTAVASGGVTPVVTHAR